MEAHHDQIVVRADIERNGAARRRVAAGEVVQTELEILAPDADRVLVHARVVLGDVKPVARERLGSQIS